MKTTQMRLNRPEERSSREKEILLAAEAYMVEEGYLGMTMASLAKRVGWAKGTLYQHFPSKEEMLLALATFLRQEHAAWFARAAAFRGRSRERMMAIGEADELFHCHHPALLDIEQLLRQKSIREKTSQLSRDKLLATSNLSRLQLAQIMQDAIVEGDLPSLTPNQLADVGLGLKSLSIGMYVVSDSVESGQASSTRGIMRSWGDLRRLQHRYLDAYDWQPLSHAWDWEDTRQRIWQEVFQDEVKHLGWLSS